MQSTNASQRHSGYLPRNKWSKTILAKHILGIKFLCNFYGIWQLPLQCLCISTVNNQTDVVSRFIHALSAQHRSSSTVKVQAHSVTLAVNSLQLPSVVLSRYVLHLRKAILTNTAPGKQGSGQLWMLPRLFFFLSFKHWERFGGKNTVVKLKNQKVGYSITDFSKHHSWDSQQWQEEESNSFPHRHNKGAERPEQL